MPREKLGVRAVAVAEVKWDTEDMVLDTVFCVFFLIIWRAPLTDCRGGVVEEEEVEVEEVLFPMAGGGRSAEVRSGTLEWRTGDGGRESDMGSSGGVEGSSMDDAFSMCCWTAAPRTGAGAGGGGKPGSRLPSDLEAPRLGRVGGEGGGVSSSNLPERGGETSARRDSRARRVDSDVERFANWESPWSTAMRSVDHAYAFLSGACVYRAAAARHSCHARSVSEVELRRRCVSLSAATTVKNAAFLRIESAVKTRLLFSPRVV
jgi:hypothetical protein